MKPGILESEANSLSAADSKRKRSVLFLIDQLTELGGAERMMFELASSLMEHGYRVSIVTFRTGVSQEAQSLADEIIVLPIVSCLSVQGLRSVLNLSRLMVKRDVCLVQTYFESADLIGYIASRLAGIRNVCSSRRDMGILRSKKHNLLYRILSPLYRQVLAVSHCVARQHQQLDRINSRRLTVIHNGVSLERYDGSLDRQHILSQYGLHTDQLLITTVANVNPWKGLDIFLRAAALVHTQDPRATFVIAGDWTDVQHLEELRALAEISGISGCIHFLGRVEDVPSLLRVSDVFALLSRSEGFPNCVVEAMAASLPVVATDVGGTSEALLDGVTGYLVANEDYQAAANHLLSLLADGELRQSMGARGRQLVEEQFSKQTMVKRHMEVYDAILAL